MAQERESQTPISSQASEIEASRRNVSLEHTRLRLIRRLVAEGSLTPDILERAQLAFQSISSTIEPSSPVQVIPKVDAGPKQEEERQLPLIKVFEQSHQVQLESWELPKKIQGRIRWAIFNYLCEHPQEEIPTAVLKEIALKLGSKDANPVGVAMWFLRDKIEPDPKNPRIIITTGRDIRSSYRLNARVEFVGEEKQPEGEKEPEIIVGSPVTFNYDNKPRKEFPPPLDQSRIDAHLALALDIPSIDEIKQTLGLAKSGRRLTDEQIVWTLIGSAHHLFERVRKGNANVSEKELWEFYKRETDIQEDKAILDFLRKKIQSWFRGEDEVTLPTPDWNETLPVQVPPSRPIPFEQPVKKPKVRTIERRDPEIRAKINEILEQIKQANIHGTISTSTLSSLFRRLTGSEVQLTIEKGYIKPHKGSEYFPVFNEEEITVLLYVHDYGNNLNNRLVKELKEIIREETERRAKDN